jgi:hypothetical protein
MLHHALVTGQGKGLLAHYKLLQITRWLQQLVQALIGWMP